MNSFNLEIRKDIPFQYNCGAHRMMPDYPKQNHILIDLIQFCLDKAKRKKKLNYNDFILTVEDINMLYNGMDDIAPKVKTYIENLINEGFLTKNEDTTVSIDKKSITEFYNIIE